MHNPHFRMASNDLSGPPIYFDANPLSDRHLTGIGRYSARLAMALASIQPIHIFKKNEVIQPPDDLSWSQDQDLAKWARHLMKGKRVELGTPPPGSIGVWPLLRPIERLFDQELSILHDLTPLILPQTHKSVTRSHFQGLCSKSIRSSDLVITDSHSTAADASWLTAFNASRMMVAYPGPSLCVGAHVHRSPVKRRGDVGLVVSTLEPRKNPAFLFRWFHSSTTLPERAELWWVGSLGWLTSRRDLKQFERQEGSHRRIRFLGIVSDSTLCKLYQTAGWSIYPSLYEGFGFPVLDALRHGTPVLTSQNSSLREFASPGLHFFDPCDASTVDSAWQALQAESPIQIPREPLERLYSWDNLARTLLEACGRIPVQVPASTVAA